MNIFSRIKTFLKQEPEEQFVGYSVPELKSVFAKASLPRNSFLLPLELTPPRLTTTTTISFPFSLS